MSFLVANGRDWTDRWRRRHAAGQAFVWFRHQRRPLNQLLSPLLVALTDGRCAYCDHFPLGLEADPEIDHHRPKSEFVDQAFAWENLYPVCRYCNRSKLDQWDDALLRPDDLEYAFARYFDFDGMTGRLAPNPVASPDDQHRAARSIAIYGLNDGLRPSQRRKIHRTPPSPEDRPYRFLFD